MPYSIARLEFDSHHGQTNVWSLYTHSPFVRWWKPASGIPIPHCVSTVGRSERASNCGQSICERMSRKHYAGTDIRKEMEEPLLGLVSNRKKSISSNYRLKILSIFSIYMILGREMYWCLKEPALRPFKEERTKSIWYNIKFSFS